MFKLIIVIILCLSSSFASVSFKWTGVSGFILEDERTTLYFDPNLTMVTVWDWMPWNTIDIDKKEVDYWMQRCQLSKLDAIFINHSHYDHMLDAPYLIKKFGGKLYGSESSLNYGRGMGISEKNLEKIDYNKKYQVGDFVITPLKSEHPNHVGPLLISDGKIKKPLKTPTHPINFRLGKTHSFLIQHPEGRILFSAVAKISNPDPLKGIKADALIVTMAKRGDTKTFVEKRILPVKANKIIPVHYDNFFLKLKREGEPHYLPFVGFDEFVQTTSSLLEKKENLIIPSYCQKEVLF